MIELPCNEENRHFWARQKFPFKLHKALELLHLQPGAHLIAEWDRDGQAFYIHMPEDFVHHPIISYFFNQTKYSKFDLLEALVSDQELN